MPPAPRILIAGEDVTTTSLISTILQKSGYGIVGIIKTGEEALVKTVKTVPDLIVMDVTLAGPMDGIDAAHYIFQLFHVPVVFVAATTDEAKVARVKYAQPYGLVFKPFAAIEIAAGVDLALYSHADRVGTLGKAPVGDSRKMMDNPDEAVIILDKRGRVIFLNIYAEWFVDMPLKKAFTRHWRDVVMFMSDTNNEEVSDPITEATRHMAGSIYDGSISIVTTTSKRRKVILTIRPIMDNHDRLIAALVSLKENKKTYR